MITVLGHTSCGAVSAAVDALLSPQVYLDVIHDPTGVSPFLLPRRVAPFARVVTIHGPAGQIEVTGIPAIDANTGQLAIMDDDVLPEPESVLRATAFAAFAWCRPSMRRARRSMSMPSC